MTNPIIEKADKVIARTYNRFPFVFIKGSGCTLWNSEGRSYTDFVAGIAVCNLGHAHPKIKEALARQAETLLHVSNLYYTVPQTELAALLTENSFGDRVFFCNSGAEANEAAIKLARKYFSDQGQEKRCRIVSMEKSFHGRTMGTLSATGQDKIKKGFQPVLNGFDFVPFNDADAIRQAITEKTCAVILEPVQGEGGVNCPDPEYLQNVRRICDETGTLLIFDEIQTGMGRTGKLFAYQHFGVEPDVMTLAKALGNGLPIGAMVARENFAKAFDFGSHASTFGGTPIITAAACEVVKMLLEPDVLDQSSRTAAYFKEQLQALKERYDIIEEVRGLGLLLGLKLKTDGGPIVNACAEKGFLINCIQGNVLRFIPPLIITVKEIDALIACLDSIFKKI